MLTTGIFEGKHKVSVVQIGNGGYPDKAPYHPSLNYIEYPFSGYFSSTANHVYGGIRQLFFKLGLDKKHWNTREWNPLGCMIKEGMTVVIKPNFVLSRHEEKKDIFSIITHPSILRVILDYCWIALKGKGKVIIADAPHYNCNFEELLLVTQLDEVKNFINKFSGPTVEIADLRKYWCRSVSSSFYVHELAGDPQGGKVVDLEDNSAFCNHPNPKKLFGSLNHRNETLSHHYERGHKYEISRTILGADVIICVPKMKVHKKSGVTLNLKNLVGICTDKDSIVHFTLGSPSKGGDQFPESLLTNKERFIVNFGQRIFERWTYEQAWFKSCMGLKPVHDLLNRFLYPAVIGFLRKRIPAQKRLLVAGNWHGNNSVWRMISDLAKIVYFVDKEGRLCPQPQRKLFSIVDGIIAGENKGPNIPDPKPIGVLIGGESLLAVDIVATRLMGFNPLKLRQFSILNDFYGDFTPKKLDDIEIIADSSDIQGCLENKKDKFFDFVPYPGWAGHIEI